MTAWKKAYVTPIYKKGDKPSLINYHPISLTLVVCKLMEHIPVSHTYHAPPGIIEVHNILLDTLFGFRSKHSCESQSLLTTIDLAKAIDRRLQTDIGILDSIVSKVFDKEAIPFQITP